MIEFTPAAEKVSAVRGLIVNHHSDTVKLRQAAHVNWIAFVAQVPWEPPLMFLILQAPITLTPLVPHIRRAGYSGSQFRCGSPAQPTA